jgi:hypothetical protein
LEYQFQLFPTVFLLKTLNYHQQGVITAMNYKIQELHAEIYKDLHDLKMSDDH